MLVAGVLTLFICIYAGNLFELVVLPKYVYEILKIISIGSLCMLVYTFFNIVFKMEYANELIKRLKNK